MMHKNTITRNSRVTSQNNAHKQRLSGWLAQTASSVQHEHRVETLRDIPGSGSFCESIGHILKLHVANQVTDIHVSHMTVITRIIYHGH